MLCVPRGGQGAQHGVCLGQKRGQLAQGVGFVKRLAQRRAGAAHGNVAAAKGPRKPCLLYTSDAADDLLCVELGGSRII